MNDDQDRAEFEGLMAALAEASTEEEREPIRKALGALHERRAAEKREEIESFVRAFGGDPEPGTVVADGPTRHRPPIHVDVETGEVHWPPRDPPDQPPAA